MIKLRADCFFDGNDAGARNERTRTTICPSFAEKQRCWSVRPSVVCSVCWTFVSQRDPLLTIDICRRGNTLEGLGLHYLLGPLLVLKCILRLFIETVCIISNFEK